MNKFRQGLGTAFQIRGPTYPMEVNVAGTAHCSGGSNYITQPELMIYAGGYR